MSPELQLGPLRVTAPDPTSSSPAAGEPPTLSVLITYYNGERVICDAVRSVLAQTLRPHEIVICDDGSPDDLDTALGSLRSEVRVVRKRNGGTGSALNAAVRAASGEYVVQLDQDDACEPRRIEAMSAVLSARPDVDIVASDAIIELDGTPVSTFEALTPHPSADQRTAVLHSPTFLWPAIRRSLLLDAGGYDESFKAVEDWECFSRLVLGGAVTAFIHEPLYRWRLTAGSRSSHDTIARVQDAVDLTAKALSHSPLDATERADAQALLATRRRWLAREQARDAVEKRAADARRRSLELVLGSGFDRATRVKAGVAVLSPRLAARFMARRHERADPVLAALAQRGFQPPA